MNEFIWSYASNTFDVTTRSSTKKMSIIGPDHLSKLEYESSDPDIGALSTATQGPLDAFSAKYSTWMSLVGAYKGETNRFTTLLNTLRSTTIKQWDVQIQVEFMEGTSDYIAIMPNGRAPFQTGAYDVRLAKVSALADRLLSYPTLSTLQTTVAAYYTVLLEARDLQQQKEGAVKHASNELNLARVALAKQMYKNLAALMIKFYNTPRDIERFYDLTLIRSHNTPGIDPTPIPTPEVLGPNQIKNALQGVFTATTLLTIVNTGTEALLFYLATNPTTDVEPPTVGITIDAGITITHEAQEFGSVFTTFLNVKNLSNMYNGSYEINIEED